MSSSFSLKRDFASPDPNRGVDPFTMNGCVPDERCFVRGLSQHSGRVPICGADPFRCADVEGIRTVTAGGQRSGWYGQPSGDTPSDCGLDLISASWNMVSQDVCGLWSLFGEQE